MRFRSLLVPAAALAVAAVTAVPGSPADRLGAPNAADRDRASEELLALGEAARPALEAAVASPDAEVRSRARSLLRRLDGAREDPAALRYRESVQLLRDAWGSAAHDAVSAADGAPLAGSELDLRLRGLAPESGRALADLAAVTTRRTFVSAPLAMALARYATSETLAALARTWRRERLLPSAALLAARELDQSTAVDPLRAEAVRAAGAEPALALLGDPLAAAEAPRRRAGVALAAAFAGRGAAELLGRAARDVDAGVRREAARALGRHDPAGGADALTALCDDPDAGVREAALAALARVPAGPRPGPAVRRADDDAVAVRRASAALLAFEATPAELPLLDQLARDPSPSVRAAARHSLAALRAD